MARVTLLSADGCPNALTVLSSLRSLAAELGFDLEHRRVANSEEAEHLGFPGSPTVLIDGRDPFPASAGTGLSCRLYATEDGLRGAPPQGELREALRVATELTRLPPTTPAHPVDDALDGLCSPEHRCRTEEAAVAVVCELHVPERGQDDADALAIQVERRLEARGSPPDGLMFVCVHPERDGFRIVMVFRSAETARAEIDGPLRADASVVELELGEATMAPVWGMAFPGRV